MRLLHRISHEESSILCVVVSSTHVFAGTQNNAITVHDLQTFSHVKDLVGHHGSILSLALSPDQTKLFSSGGDSIIKCWCTSTFRCLNVIYSTYDVGDIFSTAYSDLHDTLYLGSQNTSLQWVKFGIERPVPSRESYPTRRPNKFFDSLGKSGRTGLPLKSPVLRERTGSFSQEDIMRLVEIDKDDIVQYAHYSYVFCLLLGTFNSEQVLFTGGGDAAINIWSLQDRPRQIRSLCQSQGSSVLSLTQHESLLYAGHSQGSISVWDLETHQLLRRLQAHDADVQSLSISRHSLLSVGGSQIKHWKISSGVELSDVVEAHQGIVLCCTASRTSSRRLLVTGGTDNDVAVWDLTSASHAKLSSETSNLSSLSIENDDLDHGDSFLRALQRFVSYKSISGTENHVEDCRRAATFLKNTALELGAEAHLLPTSNNPIVMIKFTANANLSKQAIQPNAPVRDILYYGHYDVIAANEEVWNTPPFRMSGRNGYLYGRGVSDNKAPVLSALYAAHDLLVSRSLGVNLTMLIEGEEESGSRGFVEAVRQGRAAGKLQHFHEVFLSNSYWLDDHVPCITYGLRGVIHITVKISNELPDLHSGVEGGSVREPTIDLVNLLGKLTDDTGHITIPQFYDPVRQVTVQERKFYEEIAKSQTAHANESQNAARHTRNGQTAQLCQAEVVEDLMNRWCRPSLTIHQIEVSGPGNSTIIPHSASSKISLRIVPDQDLQTISRTLIEYLESSFARFKSTNSLSVTVERTSDWWLSPPTSAPFTRLAQLIEQEWQVKPLVIREGGSIPMVRWLEQEFGATAIHFPMGQSSDSAHLVNERLRILNLEKGRAIIKGYFSH